PTGINYDTSGIIRNVIFGLRITEIVRGQRGSEFIEETLREYRTLCESQGVKDFDITADDLNILVIGRMNDVVMIINKLIKHMPIAPFNPEEIRQIHQNIHEVLIKA
ncbi:MAG: hypothetical protein ABH862_06435, partial [Candidatus Omnitrophota bacterium]